MLAVYNNQLTICVDNMLFYEDGDIANAILTTAFLQKHGPCTCLDIGMDKGWWSRWVLARQPNATVHGFEPNPNSYKSLVNDLSTRKGLVLHNVAVSDTSGTLLFNCNGPQSNSRSSEQNESSICVPCVDLPTYLPNLGQIGLVKIDTEGHELHVLKSLLPLITKGHIQCIISEFTAYWHGNTLEEVFDKSLELITTIHQHMPFTYILSRASEHVFGPIEHIGQFLTLCFTSKYQVDFVFSCEALNSYDIVLEPYEGFVKRFILPD